MWPTSSQLDEKELSEGAIKIEKKQEAEEDNFRGI